MKIFVFLDLKDISIILKVIKEYLYKISILTLTFLLIGGKNLVKSEYVVLCKEYEVS